MAPAVRHGPNTEQVVLPFPLGRALERGNPSVEFDLAQSGLDERRVEGMWVDLIFERPEMNGITLRDLTFARSPRAEL